MALGGLASGRFVRVADMMTVSLLLFPELTAKRSSFPVVKGVEFREAKGENGRRLSAGWVSEGPWQCRETR